MKLRNSLFLAPFLAPLLSTTLSVLTLSTLALSATGLASAQSVSTLGAKTPPAQSPYQGTVVEDIIARVNDGIISQSDFDRANQELESQAKQRNWPQSELDSQRKELLRDLIDTQLLLSKGKELGISGETETVRQLDELRKQNHLESMEDLQKAAEQQGVSFEDFKASIRNRVITSQVIRDEVGRRINISQADEQQYYDEHKADFDRPEQVRLSEILVPTANPDDASEVATAQTKADALEQELKSGKDFAAVAKTGSGGPTAAQGGVIGDFKRGQLAKVLEDQTFSLQAGGYTAPIRTKQGFVILKVDEHQPGGVAPFKDVEAQIQDQVGMTKMNPALRQYLGRLREEAYIDIKPGFVDSGASANQVKPIFSAYQPPQPKKKKHLARTRFGGRGRTRTHATTQTAKGAAPVGPAVPAGVPSLADVPQGTGATSTTDAASQSTAATETAPATGSTPATASTSATGTTQAAANKPSAAAAAKARQAMQTASAGTMKPGKKEKIRYGQAPRETLPSGASETQDAGATTANGNASNGEQQLAAQETPPNTGQAGSAGQSTTPSTTGARYTTGENAVDEGEAAPEQKKTRFAARASMPKVKKVKNKDKTDPLAPPPAASDEIATKQTQAAPLGLSGDTSKKPPKVKATGPKTRYSDEAKNKDTTSAQPADQQATPASPALTTPAAAAAEPRAPLPQDTPASPAGPSANPDAHTPTGQPQPARTQDTPNGTGDPLGPTVPAPQQPPQ